jgi:hypothetical protein
LTSNDRYYHPADGVFNYNIVLAHAICPNFFAEVAQWQKKPMKSVSSTLSCPDPLRERTIIIIIR